MADVFDLYVKDNRTIQFKFTEPIMLEDSHVTDWVFHIPRILNNLDVSGWAWWLVYINARGQKYSELLTLSEDPESPLEKCIATYSVDYGMSIRAGVVRFSLEAINADTQGTILNEWHTQTYQAMVQDTLQGNQVEYAETESDIISALIIEVQNKVRQLVGGATPEPKSLIADMTDTKKVYLYVGSETGESTNYWYYHNGSAWVAGGVYASGITVDAVPTQGSNNAVRSGGVYSALADKVSKPLTSPNGTNGQLLRTLGNGQTEWADFATPTTEQVGEAVEGWLDEHPEATTTVQDWSLTADKFVKGSLGYITPQMFGAKADGITDDTSAIKSAIDYGMENDCAIYFPKGTYIISPQQLIINFIGGESLVMYGDGIESCIKRKDESLQDPWDRLFVFNNSNASADSKMIYIHDLFIDSNRRGQSNATDDYTYEPAIDFVTYFSNHNYCLETAIYNNLWFYDGVSDHLDFTGTGIVHIKNIVINNVFTWGRQAVRNDIDFPGIPMGNVYISNVSCKRIHSEYNGTPTEPQYFFLSNVRCEDFTFGGEYQHIKANGLQVDNQFVYTGLEAEAKFVNCEFNLKNHSYLGSTGKCLNIEFEQCTFKSYEPGDGSVAEHTGMDFYAYPLKINNYVYVKFKGCCFGYGGTSESVTGSPVMTTTSMTNTQDIDDIHIDFDNCDISDKFSHGLHFMGCGVVTVKNMVIKNPTVAYIDVTHGWTDLTFDNVAVRGPRTEKSLQIMGTRASAALILRGELELEASNMKLGRIAGGTWANADYRMRRYILSTAPLDSTLAGVIFKDAGYRQMFRGDEVRYIGANRNLYPEKWICLESGSFSSANTTSEKFKTIGKGYGDTVSRPTCYLSKGFEYFDTDLGKPIYWDGTGWVDSTGTTA